MHGIERKGERRGEGLGGGEEEHTHEDLDHMVDKISVERLSYAYAARCNAHGVEDLVRIFEVFWTQFLVPQTLGPIEPGGSFVDETVSLMMYHTGCEKIQCG